MDDAVVRHPRESVSRWHGRTHTHMYARGQSCGHPRAWHFSPIVSRSQGLLFQE